MAKKKHSVEQIIHKLREAEVIVARGGSVEQLIAQLPVEAYRCDPPHQPWENF